MKKFQKTRNVLTVKLCRFIQIEEKSNMNFVKHGCGYTPQEYRIVTPVIVMTFGNSLIKITCLA